MLHNVRKTRIEWSDCDPAGIIFYPRYFEIFDTGTTALFERSVCQICGPGVVSLRGCNYETALEISLSADPLAAGC